MERYEQQRDTCGSAPFSGFSRTARKSWEHTWLGMRCNPPNSSHIMRCAKEWTPTMPAIFHSPPCGPPIRNRSATQVHFQAFAPCKSLLDRAGA